MTEAPRLMLDAFLLGLAGWPARLTSFRVDDLTDHVAGWTAGARAGGRGRLGLPASPDRRAVEVSGVKGGPQGGRAQRDA